MISRGRLVVAIAAVGFALLVPAAASAHAYLIKTVPAASVVLNAAPASVQLTYDEAVEPRFAIISVTDKDASSETTGPVSRSPSNPDTLLVPLRPHLPEGWYLVYWRAISVDGHPVQGAFTFAVGPNPGPAPQFVIPHVGQSATTPSLVVARWLVLLSAMSAIGLLAIRLAIARPAIRGVKGSSLRDVSVAFGIASTLSLVATVVYVEESTAVDSLRSFWDVGNLVPLWRTTAFGRGYVDLLICLALFTVAGWIAIWVDRPERERRSVAEILAFIGAAAAAVAVVFIPGISGHAAQTSPRGLAVTLDGLHVGSGSLWLGGLVGLLILWFGSPSAIRSSVLALSVPRFSNVALVSVLVLLGSGIWASVLHLPIWSALWTTSYGQVILAKASILALAASVAAVNLLGTKPRLRTAGPDAGVVKLLRATVSLEVVLVVGAVFAAALLSSLAPPSKFLGEEGGAIAKVGPGKVARVVHRGPYTLSVLVDPNKAAAPNRFALQVTKGGKPVTGANVTVTFAMLDMEMGNQEFQLTETSPGVYSRTTPALVMVGHWGLDFGITPNGGQPFTALIVDRANG